MPYISAVLIIAGEEHLLRAGDAAVVPPDTPYQVRVVGACRAVIADFPLRTDLPGVKFPIHEYLKGR